jgi:glycosyltransferase involved in cell wall biosynthesis
MNPATQSVMPGALASSIQDPQALSICKVWDAEYPWDVRVEKVALALTAAGHSVHIAARNRDGRPVDEVLAEGTVHRMPPLPGIGRRLNAAAMFPAFFNPRWIRLIRRTCQRTRANIILCRDLPLAPSAIFVGRRLGLPVVLDMAENYPAMLEEVWEAGHQRPLDLLVRNPTAASWLERWTIKRVDHTLVVVEESRERLIKLGVPEERITVVSNTPSLSRLAAPGAVRRSTGDELTLVYLGLLEAARGIGPLLEGVARCRQKGTPVRLAIYGDGREAQLFANRAKELALSGAVTFHGRVPYQDALEAIRTADIGVVPHFADHNWNTTIPNKLFDYMAAGLPVLTSNARPAARVVRETGCGEVFRDRDIEDLVGAMERLRDGGRRALAGDAGRRAIATRYNWETDALRLTTAVEAAAMMRTGRPMRSRAPR